MGPAAAGAMIDFMFAVNRVIAPFVRALDFAADGFGRHWNCSLLPANDRSSQGFRMRRKNAVKRTPRSAIGALGAQPVERDLLGKFGADLLTRGPADNRIGAIAARKHQPDSRADFELGAG